MIKSPGNTSGKIITLDSSIPPVPNHLSDQGYVLRQVESEGRHMYQVAGKSPAATMWAVYDLVERWGVRYELFEKSGDAARGEFSNPELDNLDQASGNAAEHMQRCAELMRKACQTFAEGIRDRIDLGALAALNCYNLEVVNALACITRIKASMFSCTEK